MTPDYLQKCFLGILSFRGTVLRSSENRTDYCNKIFFFTGAKVWNSLPNDLKYFFSITRADLNNHEMWSESCEFTKWSDSQIFCIAG